MCGKRENETIYICVLISLFIERKERYYVYA